MLLARCWTVDAVLVALLCSACAKSDTTGVAQHCVPVVLQVGNERACPSFATKPSKELAANYIGSVAAVEHIGDWVWNTGLQWMEVIIDPTGQWQYVDWQNGSYAVDPEDEQVIDDLVRNGVRLTLMLDVWGPEHRVVFYKSEEDIQRYLNWVRFMVRHFKGRIEYYQILNEPDLNFEAPSGMPVDAYVNLIKRTVPVIRFEDPQAKIAIGALPSPSFDHVRAYMWGLLQSDVMPLVDGFSWHPMYGAAPADDPRGVRQGGQGQLANYWEVYPTLVGDIKQVAAAAGFTGEYFVAEMMWRTPLEPHETEPYGFTDISGAKYYARAITIHRGLGITTGVAFTQDQHGRPRSHGVIRALCTVLAGAQPADLPVDIQSGAGNIKHYGFAWPNGDKLLALWTDGAAVEDAPGVNAVITLAGLAPRRITAIDVLHGVEQELNGSLVNGNLVLRGVLVRDYPVMLKFTSP